MKSRSFVLQACAVGVVTAALFLTACGGLGGGYSYPYYPPYQPSHSSGSASDSSSSSSTPESSSSESSSEEPSFPASSEPPAPSEPELTPEQRLALYRSEVLQLLNTGRTVPFSAPASALSDAAQTRAEELQQTGRLSHKRPNGKDYTSLLPGSNLPGFVSKELYASGQATPAAAVLTGKQSSIRSTHRSASATPWMPTACPIGSCCSSMADKRQNSSLLPARKFDMLPLE